MVNPSFAPLLCSFFFDSSLGISVGDEGEQALTVYL